MLSLTPSLDQDLIHTTCVLAPVLKYWDWDSPLGDPPNINLLEAAHPISNQPLSWPWLMLREADNAPLKGRLEQLSPLPLVPHDLALLQL